MSKLLDELFKGAWSSLTAYTVGDIVTLDGSSYICIENNTNQTPPNATYWGLLAEAGADLSAQFEVEHNEDGTHKNTVVVLLSGAQTITGQKTFNEDIRLASEKNIQVNGADPKRGLYIPASALTPATTNGCGALTQAETSSNKVNYKYLPFDGATEEYAWFGPIQAPDYWDLSTITVKFHFRAASGSGDVIWGAAALAASDNDTEDTALGTAQTVTDTAPNATTERTTAATSAITVGGSPSKGDLIYIRVYRDADAAGDTLNSVDAWLKAITVKFGVGQYSDE